MSQPPNVLAVLTDPVLRDEADRIGAAAGLPVVHAGTAQPVRRRSWSAAAAVLLDEAAVPRCRQAALPQRPHVVMVSGAEPTPATWAAAIAVGAQQVLTLPTHDQELVRELAEAGEAASEAAGAAAGAAVRHSGPCAGRVLAVVGGRGGAGSSLFAAAVAHTATDALLVDLDLLGGGIDLVLGTENTAGLRWGDLGVQGGRLRWSALREALPRHRNISVLSATGGAQVTAAPVNSVIDAGRRGGVTVVCDVPRWLSDAGAAALDTADLVVVVCPCDVRSCAATAAIAPTLAAINPNIGLVVRGPAPGGLRAAEVADLAGMPLLAAMRAEPRLADQLEHGGLRLRQRSALAAAARRVLNVLPAGPAAAAAHRAGAA